MDSLTTALYCAYDAGTNVLNDALVQTPNMREGLGIEQVQRPVWVGGVVGWCSVVQCGGVCVCGRRGAEGGGCISSPLPTSPTPSHAGPSRPAHTMLPQTSAVYPPASPRPMLLHLLPSHTISPRQRIAPVATAGLDMFQLLHRQLHLEDVFIGEAAQIEQ